MPGLKYDGIPLNLKNTSFPFSYNDFDYLLKLINKKNIGIIKMEVMRNMKPKNNFLQKIRYNYYILIVFLVSDIYHLLLFYYFFVICYLIYNFS